MFNITIKASNLKGLRETMKSMGVTVDVETSFVEDGIRVLDVAVGSGEFLPRVAKAARRYQF